MLKTTKQEGGKKKKRTYQRQSTMPSHTVTGDADTTRIQLREGRKDRLWKLLGHIAIHIVATVVRRLCGINVETGASSKVIRVIFSLDVQPTLR